MFNFKKMERPWAPVPLPFVGGPAKIRKSYYFLSEIDLCVERKLKKKKKNSRTISGKHKLKLLWDKVFKNGPSKICGRQPLKNLKGYGSFLNTFSPI